MESSNLKAPGHARSTSLPSTPHPLIPEFNEHLRRLEASGPALSLINHKLNNLKDLHDCVENLLLLPITQQNLAKHCNKKWVDELLDGSVRLLDVCGIAKDALLQTREHVHELHSSMRRRRGAENGVLSEVAAYLTSRKKVKKAIRKALKGLEKKCSLNKQPETVSMISMLREVETTTLKVIEYLLSSIAGETAHSKSSGWSLVSNLKWHKLVECEESTTAELGEFEKVDSALLTLIAHKTKSNPVHIDNLQVELEKLETSTQDLEEGIEILHRRLIRTRVSLLNILSQ